MKKFKEYDLHFYCFRLHIRCERSMVTIRRREQQPDSMLLIMPCSCIAVYRNAEEPTGPGIDIEQVLRVLKSFHVLKQCDPGGYCRWSKHILFTCSCPQFFKTGSCEHSINPYMIINKSVEVTDDYCAEKAGAAKPKRVKDAWGRRQNFSSGGCAK